MYVVISDNVSIDDIVRQVRAIKEFPAIIKLYDRVFTIDSYDGLFGLIQGLEIGNYTTLDHYEEKNETCVVCECKLLPNSAPPHCEYCVLEEKHIEEWEDKQ
jgi:hypothetical protein